MKTVLIVPRPLHLQDPEEVAIWRRFDPRTNPALPTLSNIHGHPQPSDGTAYTSPLDGTRGTLPPGYVYDPAIDYGSHVDEHGRPYWLPPAPDPRNAPIIDSERRTSPSDLSSYGDQLHAEAPDLVAETTHDARNSDQELYTNLTTVIEQARNRLDPDQVAQLERMSTQLATQIISREQVEGPSSANRSATDSGHRPSRRPFPEIRPLNLAALQDDNPVALEAELRRGLEDFVTALEVIGEALDDLSSDSSSSDDEGEYENGNGNAVGHGNQDIGNEHGPEDGSGNGSSIHVQGEK